MPAYQGVFLLLSVVVGVGLAVYHYYNENQPQRNGHCSNGGGDRSYQYHYNEPGDDTLPKRKNTTRKRRESNTDGDDHCSICMDQLGKSKILAVLPCSHSFHQECVMKWVQDHKTCPNCRNPAL